LKVDHNIIIVKEDIQQGEALTTFYIQGPQASASPSIVTADSLCDYPCIFQYLLVPFSCFVTSDL